MASAQAGWAARHSTKLMLGTVLGLGVALRLWGVDFGLPCTYARPDEGAVVHKALSIAAGDPNPHFFNYPSLHFYLLAAVYGLAYGVGWLTGHFGPPADFARAFLRDPTALYLLARLVSVAAGSASVVIAYGIGRRLRGETTGIIAAAFLAVAYLHVRESH